MKRIQKLFHVAVGIMLLTANADAGRWLTRDPIEHMERDSELESSIIVAPTLTLSLVQQEANLYAFVGNNPVSRIDPLGLWWWDGDYIEWGAGSLLGLIGDPGTTSEAWGGFAEGWSKGGQGVVNAFSGGLFDTESGLFYDTFDQQWRDLGYEGTRCDDAFKFGNNMGRVAVTSLAAAGGLQLAGIQSRIALHGSHHTFGPLGRLPHVQLNWWRAGVKGSGGAARIPVPSGTPGFPP